MVNYVGILQLYGDCSIFSTVVYPIPLGGLFRTEAQQHWSATAKHLISAPNALLKLGDLDKKEELIKCENDKACIQNQVAIAMVRSYGGWSFLLP